MLVVGAGDMGEGMAVALRQAGVGEMLVANRTVRRAVEVASRVDGLAVGLHEVDEALVDADVLLTSTGAGSVLFEHHTIAGLMARRPDRPLLIVDMAVPRDVDRGVTAIPGVTLLDLDDLRAFAERGVNERRGEAVAARAIAVDELDRYAELATARQAAPLVSRLHERAEAVRQAELERHRSKLDDLDDAAARRGRSGDQGPDRQAAARAVGPPEVRSRQPSGRAIRRGPPGPVRSALTVLAAARAGEGR